MQRRSSQMQRRSRKSQTMPINKKQYINKKQNKPKLHIYTFCQVDKIKLELPSDSSDED
jgi:hypothetical protein